ncbi:putative CoA ligase [Trichinella spiralis]|uniref:CoA ligase n=1 Tax=Trichinella spiralis TaxID=6334 RepID=A0ABR3KS18_TRISP
MSDDQSFACVEQFLGEEKLRSCRRPRGMSTKTGRTNQLFISEARSAALLSCKPKIVITRQKPTALSVFTSSNQRDACQLRLACLWWEQKFKIEILLIC